MSSNGYRGAEHYCGERSMAGASRAGKHTERYVLHECYFAAPPRRSPSLGSSFVLSDCLSVVTHA